MLIDTHAHLAFNDFDPYLDDVILRTAQAGVQRIITIGTGVQSSQRAVALAEQYANVYAAVGIHPGSVADENDNFVEQLEPLLAHPKVVAVGECGLDYYRLPPRSEGEDDASYQNRLEGWKSRQKKFLSAQLHLAEKHGLNVVIHQRESRHDLLELLKPWHGKLRTVFHCFSGTLADARELLNHNHLVSFTGLISFKNAAQAQDCVRCLPAGSFMVETDCPYMAPVPHRGKRCEPAHVLQVAETIAALRRQTVEQVIHETGETSEQFFRF